MGIYIMDLEMPTKYGRCIVIFPDGRVTTEFGSQVIAKAVPIQADELNMDNLKEEEESK